MSKMDTLTARQRNVFEFIREKITKRGYGPTVREIGEQFGISSPNGVMCHLKALERKGLIHRSPNKSRAIELTEASKEPAGLPLLGCVAAGLTQLACEQNENLSFDDLYPRRHNFVLQVTGESMIDAHINDGDYVVVKRVETAKEGEMVVAQTPDGEATLKYWFPEQGRVRLQPANSQMDPIYVAGATVMGVVVGVLRTKM